MRNKLTRWQAEALMARYDRKVESKKEKVIDYKEVKKHFEQILNPEHSTTNEFLELVELCG